MRLKVISGGQTGVDISALRAAQHLGIPTGGWMPKGFRTQIGPRPKYATMFNMKEHDSYEYPPRTEANVMEADVTVRIAHDFLSPGERCTHRYILKHNKPHLNVSIQKDGTFDSDAPKQLALWIDAHWHNNGGTLILNIAGNSGLKLEAGAERLLSQTFSLVLESIRKRSGRLRI